MTKSDYPHISEMVGKIFTEIESDEDSLVFIESNGTRWVFFHEQDCCENVYIADVEGDYDDIINTPLLVAEEADCDLSPLGDVESYTWTFYKFATVKGWLDVRWYGTSNGYYSESVSLRRIRK